MGLTRCYKTERFYTFITITHQSPLHINHHYTYQSPSHINHHHTSITITHQSPLHINHRHTSITITHQSPLHINHRYTSVAITHQSMTGICPCKVTSDGPCRVVSLSYASFGRYGGKYQLQCNSRWLLHWFYPDWTTVTVCCMDFQLTSSGGSSLFRMLLRG